MSEADKKRLQGADEGIAQQTNSAESFLDKKITRRKAIGSGAAAGLTVAGLVVGVGAGYFLGSSQPARTVTSTQTSTVTSTQTIASTATSTSVSTLTTASGGGPGIDYFYDKSLSGTQVNWLAAALPEKPPVFKFIPLFEQETGIKVNLT